MSQPPPQALAGTISVPIDLVAQPGKNVHVIVYRDKVGTSAKTQIRGVNIDPKTAQPRVVGLYEEPGVVGLIEKPGKPRLTKGFLWSNKTFTSLQYTPKATFTSAVGINSAGYIVGRYEIGLDKGGYLRDPLGKYYGYNLLAPSPLVVQGYLGAYHRAHPSTTLPPPPTNVDVRVTLTQLSAINDSNVILGVYEAAVFSGTRNLGSDGRNHGFLIRLPKTLPQPLPAGFLYKYPPTYFDVAEVVCFPAGINSAGDVVGWAGKSQQAFLIRHQDIPATGKGDVTPGTPIIDAHPSSPRLGAVLSFAHGINKNSACVGWYSESASDSYRGFIWPGTGFDKLGYSALLATPPNPAYSTQLMGITDNNWIAGQYTDVAKGVIRGFLLQP